MNTQTHPLQLSLVGLINFFLNSIKNSQLILLITISIVHGAVFAIIILGFFFTFYEEGTVKLILTLMSPFVDTWNNTDMTYQIDGMRLIQRYIWLTATLGVVQEVIFAISSKGHRDGVATEQKPRHGRFWIITMAVILVVEIILALSFREPVFAMAGGISFVLWLVTYVWYRLVTKAIYTVQDVINKPPNSITVKNN